MIDIVEIIVSHLKEYKWRQAEIVIQITPGSMGYESLCFIDEENNEGDFWIDFEDIRKLFGNLRESYNLSKGTADEFNRYRLILKSDKTYFEKYWWDNAEDKKDLLEGAELFYQWINERMMSMIFEFEKENNLIPTWYDQDGDLEYLNSWDRGEFSFHINEKNELEHKIVLTKDGKERVLEMPLKDYFTEGMLEHHTVTNTVLSDKWRLWNTMILKSLHYDIPYDKRDEFVSYFLD